MGKKNKPVRLANAPPRKKSGGSNTLLLVSAAVGVIVVFAAFAASSAGSAGTDVPNGGWELAGSDVADLEDGGACDIPRLSSLTAEEFKATYWSGDGATQRGKPFILTNVTDGWTTGAFAKAVLVEKYGDAAVKVGVSKHIPRASGDGYELTTLRDFVAQMSAPAEVADDPTYIFDQNEFFDAHPELRAELKLPPFFTADGVTLYLAVGGSRSGVQFHKHAAGWNTQIHGRKRWLLYEPETMPPYHYPTHGMSVETWLRTVFPKLPKERRPLSCTTQPGELIYVPETWYHATMNMGESIGAAGQDKEPLTKVQYHWNRGNAVHKGDGPAAALEHYEKIVKLSPSSQEGRYMEGLALTELRRSDEAVAANKRAITLAPDHSETLNNLGVVYSQMSGKLEDALLNFERAFDANPLHFQAIGNQVRILRALGRTNEAQKRDKIAHELGERMKAESLGRRG